MPTAVHGWFRSRQLFGRFAFSLSVAEIAFLCVGSFLAGYAGFVNGVSTGIAICWAFIAAIMARHNRDSNLSAGALVAFAPLFGLPWSLAIVAAIVSFSRAKLIPALAILMLVVAAGIGSNWLAIALALVVSFSCSLESEEIPIVAISTISPIFAPNVWTMLACAIASIAIQVHRAVRKSVDQHDLETRQIYLGMLQRSHPYTQGHANRVAQMARNVGKELGLSSDRIHHLEMAAVLHDVGKITIDEEILDLPRKLTEREFEHVRDHAANGGDILAPLSGLEPLAHWIRCHHERADGKGYPSGLSDDHVPLESRIISVIDAFDAMIGGDSPEEKRSYRKPMTVEAALNELKRCAGTQFDSRVVAAFEASALRGVR